MSVTTISPRQLHDLVRDGRSVELIDVRTPVEFREVHVSFARNVPLDSSMRQAWQRGEAAPRDLYTSSVSQALAASGPANGFWRQAM